MFLKSNVLTVEQVYGDLCRLELPWFQRAYAWNYHHAGRLVYDVNEAMTGARNRYSLGHMSLSRRQGSDVASLIDGHQRSMTLTILIALSRDLIGTGAMADRLHRLICGEDGRWRLLPQPAVSSFFEAQVQRRGAAKTELDGDPTELSPSEQNMLANRDHMRAILAKIAPTPQKLEALAGFLIEKCLVIVGEVEDEDEARDLLSRVEERGLDPHSSDFAKVTIVSAMPAEQREPAGRMMEEAQTLLTPDNFHNLLGHIRLLKVRKRSTRAADEEIKQRFEINKTGLDFIEGELLPRAHAMARLIASDIGSGAALERNRGALTTLGWIDHQLWMAPALHWIAVRGENAAETPLFLERLERLTYLLRIATIDPTEQEHRFLDVIKDIDGGRAVDDLASLAIEPGLRREALDTLRSRTFYAKRCSSLVLRRISINMDPKFGDPGPIDGNKVTVEHVLPRRPVEGQQWLKEFGSIRVVHDYCNRIGNLAFMSRHDNNIAANQDYVVKRLLLAQSATQFPLSKDAQDAPTWTRATIEARSERLIATLLGPWQLKP